MSGGLFKSRDIHHFNLFQCLFFLGVEGSWAFLFFFFIVFCLLHVDLVLHKSANCLSVCVFW